MVAFCGCNHELAGRLWPEVRPIIALHLATYPGGIPMHHHTNGWYWMAGVLGGASERYHGANGSHPHSTAECLRLWCEHTRTALGEATRLVKELSEMTGEQAKARHEQWIDAQLPRWASEAEAGLALIRSLAQR